MPFAQKFNYVYKDIKEAVESKDLVCIRSDENKKASAIMTEVIEQIKASDLVIVDLTDQNANVYYEAGLAHAFQKKCILLARSKADVKFDLQHVRTYFYGKRRNRLKTELAKWIEESQENGKPGM
jgi:nucleoside 2-deoxyribosyltransferase